MKNISKYIQINLLFIGLLILFSFMLNSALEAKYNPYGKNKKELQSRIIKGTLAVRFMKGFYYSDKVNLILERINAEIDQQLLEPVQTYFLNDKKNLSEIMFQSNLNFNEILKNEEILLRSFYIQFDESTNIRGMIDRIKSQCPEIELVEPVYKNQLMYSPNDTYFNTQFNLQKANIPAAWDIYQGDASVVIGISDNGVFQSHEDLVGNLAINTKEIPNNNIDDDGNGYIDDYNGYNFAHNLDATPWGNTFNGSLSHGTNCAGIACGTMNNGIGISGSSGKCKFFPLKTVATNETFVRYGYQSIVYAAVRGFKVLNCSWGTCGQPFSEFEQSVIDYAVSRDVAIVAAGGNRNTYNSIPSVFYPAGYYGVLGVGELDLNDNATSWTSISHNVRIMAPGTGSEAINNYNGYDQLGTGTSFASPLVAGVLGMIRGKYPDLSAIQSQEFLHQCSDDISGSNFTVKEFIPGKVNALKCFQTDPMSIPGIKPINFIYKNSANQEIKRFFPGDTVWVEIMTHNYLGAATGLSFNLSSAYNPAKSIKMIDSTINNISVAENSDLLISKFRIFIKSFDNEKSMLRVEISGKNNYHDFFCIPITASPEIVSFANNKIKFSVGDKGTFGFSTNSDNRYGIGFVKKALTNQLWLGGIMATAGTDKVISSVYGEPANSCDFETIKPYSGIDSNVCIIQDNISNQIGVQITQKFVFDSLNSPYTIANVKVKNVSGKTLNDVAVGYFFDWDLNDDASLNYVRYFSEACPGKVKSDSVAAELAYFDNKFPVFGCMVYSPEKGAVAQAAGLTSDNLDTMNVNLQLKSLNSGVSMQPIGMHDISFITGMRFTGAFPYNTEKNFKIVIGCAGNSDSLAKIFRNLIHPDTNSIDTTIEVDSLQTKIYPNPTSDFLNIVLKESGLYQISIYDISANVLFDQSINMNAGIPLKIGLTQLSAGNYILRIKKNEIILNQIIEKN
ncbi:MAG: S8 family serine peptidase [Candidatus Kapabacteria bacterium]|nr:S8 family serine peptidase [Candidatus Kapabacteria bacterium]